MFIRTGDDTAGIESAIARIARREKGP